MLLGCIGDDFTGSSDLANTIAKQGMKAVQYSGIPDQDAAPHVEAGVVALKSRSIPVKEAVSRSLEALDWLGAQGCRQFFFKYCSTFDSTPEGNIGPVCDALADALGVEIVIVCPAFPGAGRTLYQGHLFVNDVLLNECGMQDHPLTPMTDPDIRRWLRLQSKSTVGHVNAMVVRNGWEAVGAALKGQAEAGNRLIVVDAINDQDLLTIGRASADLRLITGGSGIALGLPANFQARGEISRDGLAWQGLNGKCVILSGSCSRATRDQVKEHATRHPVMEVTAKDVLEKKLTPDRICDWALVQDGVPLAYSSADPGQVEAAQKAYGRDVVSSALEGFFADVACALVEKGVERLIIAGGGGDIRCSG